MSGWGCANCETQNRDAELRCVKCHEPRPAPVTNSQACAHCGETVKVLRFHDDTHVARDRGAWLCASCWIPALRRRMNNETRESHCTVPGCGLTVADHIAAFRAIADSDTWGLRFASRRP